MHKGHLPYREGSLLAGGLLALGFFSSLALTVLTHKSSIGDLESVSFGLCPHVYCKLRTICVTAVSDDLG